MSKSTTISLIIGMKVQRSRPSYTTGRNLKLLSRPSEVFPVLQFLIHSGTIVHQSFLIHSNKRIYKQKFTYECSEPT